MKNAILLENGRVANMEVTLSRRFVRHKALDAIGDLALAPAPIIGLPRQPAGAPPEQRSAASADERRTQLATGRSADLLDGKINGLDQAMMGLGLDGAAYTTDTSQDRQKRKISTWREALDRVLGRTDGDTL